MSNINIQNNVNIQNIVQNLNMEKIENEVKNGKTPEEILKGIDLLPIIREEILKENPNIEEKDIEHVVQNIDVVAIFKNVLAKENLSTGIAGTSFEDLSLEEMEQLQGAGDVNGELTPTVLPGIVSAAVSAVGGAIISIARC
jgi:type 2 lantibiotic, SP_1948 family